MIWPLDRLWGSKTGIRTRRNAHFDCASFGLFEQLVLCQSSVIDPPFCVSDKDTDLVAVFLCNRLGNKLAKAASSKGLMPMRPDDRCQ